MDRRGTKRKLPPTDAASLIEGIYANEVTSDEVLAALSQHEMDWTYEHEKFYSRPTLFITLANSPSLCSSSIVKCAMEKIPDTVIVAQTTDLKRTALHFAAISNNAFFVSGLLERNCSSDFVDVLDDEAYTAMERAVCFGCKEVLDVFLHHRLITDRIYSIATEFQMLLPYIVSAAIPTCEDLPNLLARIKKTYKNDTRDDNYEEKNRLRKVIEQLDIAVVTQTLYNFNATHYIIKSTSMLRDLVSIVADYARIKMK